MDRNSPWQSMLAGGLSLVTHAGLFILLAILIPSSDSNPSVLPKSPVKYVLARKLASDELAPELDTDGGFAPIASAADFVDTPELKLGWPTNALQRELLGPPISAEIGFPLTSMPPSSIPESDASDSVASGSITSGSASSGSTSTGSPSSASTAGSTSTVGDVVVETSSHGGKSGRPRIPSGIDVAAIVKEDRLRTAARKPVGEPARVSLYGGEAAEGRSFVFLIDQSKSTAIQGSGTLSAAEGELVSALRGLQPFHRFQVIAYHDRCHYLHRRELLPASEQNKIAVEPFVHGLVSQGATEHEMALISALQHEPDVIYLLTDGGDPTLTDGQIQRITELAGGRTAIHCVGFGHGVMPASHDFLRKLATKNRGGFSYVDLSNSK